MNPEILKELYYQMLRIRMVEEKIAGLYPEREMRCPVHLCIGQEAIAAGVCANLLKEDYVLSNHRSHGHYLAKGGSLKAMVAELYGRSSGCSSGKGGSMHLVDLSAGFLAATPIVGSTIAIAAGVAMGSLMRKDKLATVVFFGDAAVEEGVFSETVNFAALKKLPVIFVCENNFYSVNTPLSLRQPQAREIFQLARGFGIESYQGDGNDVIAVYNLACQAIGKVRQGAGPVFLEFKTYRWKEHCGPDYDHESGFRPKEEFKKWQQRCPIQRLKGHLLQSGVVNNEEVDRLISRIKLEIEEAVLFAKHSPFPEKKFLWENIYAP